MELSELIESVDILDYISQYTDFTEKNGEYWGLSPLKEENTPSFSIRKEENNFYDFSSGVGGNVLTFIRYYNKCGYQRAIEILKEYAGCSGDIANKHKKLSATEVAKRYARTQKASKSSKVAPLPDDYMDRYEKKRISFLCGVMRAYQESRWTNSRSTMTAFPTGLYIQLEVQTEKSLT